MATLDDADLRTRVDRAEHKVRGALIEIENLREQVITLHRENLSLKAFRNADKETVRKLGDALKMSIEGTDNGRLIYRDNEWRHCHRTWLSFAGQASQFETDALFILGVVLGQLPGGEPDPAVTNFLHRVHKGFYHIVPQGEPPADDDEATEPTPRPDGEGIPGAAPGSDRPGEPDEGVRGNDPARAGRHAETSEGRSALVGDRPDEDRGSLHGDQPLDLSANAGIPAG